MFVIAKSNDPKIIRRVIDGTPIIFDTEDDALDYLDRHVDLKGLFVRKIEKWEWQHGKRRNQIERALRR